MINMVIQYLRGLLPASISLVLFDLIALVGLLILGFVLLHIVSIAFRFAKKTWITEPSQSLLGDFLRSTVLTRALHFIPQGLLWSGCRALNQDVLIVRFAKECSEIYFVFIICAVVTGCVMMLYNTSHRLKFFSNTPIKGLFQAINLIVFIIGVLVVISMLLNRSPVLILSGLGALSAVLMLIFKDTLLGFTAGIMLSINKMVSIGDWIEIPSANADGEVLDVSLTTVKVKNWDNTITTVPAYDLISQSFKNWRGMAESGARRIKRALILDMDTVHFATKEELASWAEIDILKPYLAERLNDVQHYNETHADATKNVMNSRKLTNLGTFRAYCQAYLNTRTTLRKDLTMIVRQLNPGQAGIPIEIYAFTNRTEWAVYESIQSDIFDHLIAALPQFGLAVFQVTSASSVTRAVSTIVPHVAPRA